MKIFLVSYSFSRGGAALAAKKFSSLIEKEMDVVWLHAESSPESKSNSYRDRYRYALHFIKRLISFILLRLMRHENPIKHSLNLFSSRNVVNCLGRAKSNAVYNIHWINNDTLSVFRFKSIPYSSVVTLHDEWMYCGAEHVYDVFDFEHNFVTGYRFFDKRYKGVNLGYFIWRLKYSALSERRDIIYTVPSTWMLNRAKSSAILSGKDIRLLPNPVDVGDYYALSTAERLREREKLGIKHDDIVVCVGALNDADNKLKGGAVAEKSLILLSSMLCDSLSQKICILTFGLGDPNVSEISFRVINYGYVSGARSMREMYSLADCSIVPSFVESFGQVAAESLACEVPVICFSTSGLKDIVLDGVNGYVAEPFSHESLASCLYKFITSDESLKQSMKESARQHVLKNFSANVVRERYFDILHEAYSKSLARDEKKRGVCE